MVKNCQIEQVIITSVKKPGREHALQKQLEILFDRCKSSNKLNDVTEESEKLHLVLKLNFQMIRFIITAGFCFTSNERFFSQLKLIKHS